MANAAQHEISEFSPTVSLVRGKVHVGVASVFVCHSAQGKVVAVDLVTHAVTTVPLAPEVGAPVWSSLSVDETDTTV